MRARRIRASFSRPASVTRTTASPGRSTSPAYSANRPSSPTLIDPRRCPDANSSAARPSITTAPDGLRRSTSSTSRLGVLCVSSRSSRFGRFASAAKAKYSGATDWPCVTASTNWSSVIGAKRVVGAPLLADRRLDRGREVLAAGRAGAVGRVDAGRVGEAQQLVVHRPVQPPGEVIRGPSDRGEQVRAADVADEQRVAGEHAPRRRIVRVLPHDDRDRLRGVARRVTDLEHHLAEREALPVGETVDREVGPGLVAVRDERRRSPRRARGDRRGSRRGSASRSPARCADRARRRRRGTATTSRCGSTTTARPVDSSPIR